LKCTDQQSAYSTEGRNVQVTLYVFMAWHLHVEETIILL